MLGSLEEQGKDALQERRKHGKPRRERASTAAQCSLELTQARVWLNRAVQEGLAEAVKRPIRYQLVESKRLSLLDSEENDAPRHEFSRVLVLFQRPLRRRGSTQLMKTNLLRPRQAVLSAALLVIAALSLAACGGGGAADTSSTPSNTPSGGASSFAAYATCLRNHGVHLPGFGGAGSGGPPSSPPANPPSGSPPQNGGGFGGNLTPAQRKAFRAAQTACASLRPQGGFGGGGGAP